MKRPPSFELPGSKGHVCQLFKALYSLKQAGRCCYHWICKAFSKFAYILSAQ